MTDSSELAARERVAERVSRLFVEFGEQPAIQYQGRWFDWSYVAAVDRLLVDQLAPVDADAAVAVMLRSRPWCLAALIALLGRGRCGVLMSPVRGDLAVLEDLRDIRPAAVIADEADWNRPDFLQACTELDVAALELRDHDKPVVRRNNRNATRADAFRVGDDVAVTALTSGTTGAPKRMPLTWSQFVPDPSASRDPAADRGALINVLPLFSIGGIGAVSSTIFGGRPISLLDRFDVEEWARLIEEHKPRRAGAPPAVLRMILDAEIPVERFRSVSSMYTASAPLSQELAAEFETRYAIPIVQGYGATEFLGGVTGWPDGLHEEFGESKRGSVGRPLDPATRLRIVDSETGGELRPGQIGRLEIDSPNRVKELPAGWVRTNDLAWLDEDGFLFIVGRSDDVIIRGGFKISPNEVEAALETHPSVVDSCVVGLPDERLGAVPHAAVVLRTGAHCQSSELLGWAKARLSPYMVPAAVKIVDAIPMNAMMKKDRAGVRTLLGSNDEGVTEMTPLHPVPTMPET